MKEKETSLYVVPEVSVLELHSSGPVLTGSARVDNMQTEDDYDSM